LEAFFKCKSLSSLHLLPFILPSHFPIFFTFQEGLKGWNFFLGQVFFPPFSFFSLPPLFFRLSSPLLICFLGGKEHNNASRRSSFHSLAFPSPFPSRFPPLAFLSYFAGKRREGGFIVRQGHGGPKKNEVCVFLFPSSSQHYYILKINI
jgi:hypothetical protein